MNRKGFTLIEILIVLAIMGMIAGMGIPQAKRIFRTNLKTAASQIAGLIRFAYDSAVVKAKVHRIVFNIVKGTYKLEISHSGEIVVLDEKPEESSLHQDSDKVKRKEIFSPFSGSMGKDIKLPSGINFENVEKVRIKRKVSEGIAYLYFFPQGMTEDTVIRLNGKKSNTGFYSIRINPINAKSKIEGRYLEIQ